MSTSSSSSSDNYLGNQSVFLGVGKDEGSAYKALEITPNDTVIETQAGNRLPGVPLAEARKLNALRSKEEQDCEGLHNSGSSHGHTCSPRPVIDFAKNKLKGTGGEDNDDDADTKTNIERAPASTNPLFPPLPVYGPATPLRGIQYLFFRVTSGVLSLSFLGAIVMGSVAKSLPAFASDTLKRIKGDDPDASRPFNNLEKERAKTRKEEEDNWEAYQKDHHKYSSSEEELEIGGKGARDRQLAGGKDKLVCDIGYYARRVGLEVEEFKVETEDGFLIDLQHVFDPNDPPFYPGEGNEDVNGGSGGDSRGRGRRKYPVLLIHGLLQSAGAFCVNDDDSLAFYLCKSGYDVWLGNNRCGMKPAHTVLNYSDPRMWAWNIRQMGILDLPALIDRVLSFTSFKKVGLVCHSQGTTQTFVALAKQQRPEIGPKISVFCALAPAVYAGPLINRLYFRFMKVIPPSMFRIVFGIHAFIPFMMVMHSSVPAKLYGVLGYKVFWFLFGWSDRLWDRGLRDRFFQFAPVYVSAETLRWWLGGFARHKCILSTRSEEEEAEEEEELERLGAREREGNVSSEIEANGASPSPSGSSNSIGGGAWYDDRCPPIALWIAGSDDLVDGPRLLRRFAKGKEPDVDLVHVKVIEEYEHLDVIWAMDAVEKVFVELKEVLWRCVDDDIKDMVVVPKGLEGASEER